MALEALSPVDGEEGEHMREGGVSGAVGDPDKLNFWQTFIGFIFWAYHNPC